MEQIKKKIIAIIPARGGSKRFPGKNIYPVLGRPLIGYPISAAKKSRYIERVIVSTDDEKIAAVAKNEGAEIPFLRPAELATDTSPVIDTMVYNLERLAAEGYKADYVVLLQPASPLMTTENIDKAIELALAKEADSVIAVAEVDNLNHPYNIRETFADGTINFWQEKLHYAYLGKSKPKFYRVGSLWLSSYDTIVKEKRLEGRKNYPLLVDVWQLLDIDYPEDLFIIEQLIKTKFYEQQ